MEGAYPKISIIVPVYNVEPYLARCVASLRGQTCPDLEILLVDDGSTDGSGLLCDGFAREDPRIRVIHKENGGVSRARNDGIAAAQGDVFDLNSGVCFELVGNGDGVVFIQGGIHHQLAAGKPLAEIIVAVAGHLQGEARRDKGPETLAAAPFTFHRKGILRQPFRVSPCDL